MRWSSTELLISHLLDRSHFPSLPRFCFLSEQLPHVKDVMSVCAQAQNCSTASLWDWLPSYRERLTE